MNPNQDDEQQVLDQDQLDQGDNQSVTPTDQDQGDDDDAGGQDDDQQVDDQGDQGTEPRQTRQERRRERWENFQQMRQGYRDTAEQRQQLLQRNKYDPLDYNKSDQYDVKQLESDRTNYGDYRYSQGIEAQRFYDQQERFYDRLETDSDYVASKYPFLDEDSDKFDPELAADINRLYFEAAVYDPKTRTVSNPNVRYKNYVSTYVRNLERYASARNAESSQNLARQRNNQGVRPTGSSGRKTLGELKPGDISRMSDAEYQKYSEEIDRQINNLLKN